MAAIPDVLPHQIPAHLLLEVLGVELTAKAKSGCDISEGLHRLLSPSGQAYLATIQLVFKKPSNQEVVTLALDSIADYFSKIRSSGKVDQTLDELVSEADIWVADNPSILSINELDSRLMPMVKTMRIFSGLSYGVMRPVFRDSTAIGSLMRRKMAPVSDRLMTMVGSLKV